MSPKATAEYARGGPRGADHTERRVTMWTLAERTIVDGCESATAQDIARTGFELATQRKQLGRLAGESL